MSRVVPETTEAGAAESELARLMETEERLSAATRAARQEAEARVGRAKSAAAESVANEERAVSAALEALRERIRQEVVLARDAADAERARRLSLYRSVSDDRLSSLADSVLAALAG